MEYWKKRFDSLGVIMEAAAFTPEKGVGEWHALLHVEPQGDTFLHQLERLYRAEDLIPDLTEFNGARFLLKHYFLSDSTNQQPFMRQEKHISISTVQQAPLDGSKVAVWCYLQRGTDIYAEKGMIISTHNHYRHLWKMGMSIGHGDSFSQTKELLESYISRLKHYGATLADNCLRTWFYVRDVDTQYAGLVKARRECFTREGLTAQTHYISSTGIGGKPADTNAVVQLGCYSATGLKEGQVRYLYAPTHLNPTYEYGVTFERGTRVAYGDRTHVFISGTASIDNKGEVLYKGDIKQQTLRMWENVYTLLHEAGLGKEDITHLVVYLRDITDYKLVSILFEKEFPHTPTVFTLAPVCRPTWLIEMECMAIKSAEDTSYEDF